MLTTYRNKLTLNITMKKLPIIVLLASAPTVVWSDGSPWLPADGRTTVGVNVTSGSTEEFFIGEDSIDLGGDLDGTFVWFTASYGYDDVWAFDVRTGYARTSLSTNPPDLDREDVADTSIGASYQFTNEFELDNGVPTISGRIGYTIGGDYETDVIEAIGDGASGFDVSLLVGKSLTPQFAVFGDLTFRQRDSGVADGIKYLFTVYYNSPLPRLGFQLGAAGIRTDSSVDIGDPGFGVEQFPQTDRDSDFLIFGADYGFTNGIGVGFSYTALVNGRNVADTDVANVSLSYSF